METEPRPRPVVCSLVVVAVGASERDVLSEMLDAIHDDAPIALVLSAASPAPAFPSSWTAVPVVDGERILPRHVYLVPIDRDVDASDGLWATSARTSTTAPLDRLFESIATSTRGSCTCVVLSGAGVDGAHGAQIAKERGALVLAIDPDGVSQAEMPRAALATQRVDLFLPAAALGRRLGELARAADGREIAARSDLAAPDVLRDILAYIRVRSGHDFAQYKRATLVRRLTRRMQVRQIDALPAYLECLREDPRELPVLVRDFMISVTSFFRDPEAFEALRQTLAPLLGRRDVGGAQVRIWVSGCATGEEAYSYAMLCAELRDSDTQVQIFATDIDDAALAVGRAGLYPISIADHVSPARLQRFFTREAGGYRVHADLRETILFSPHNILRDPPFSKLDLVSCRNLLIYLNREGQDHVLRVLQFALRPEGTLVLGSSESAETAAPLFATVDAKHRIYARRAMPTASPFGISVPTARWSPAPSGVPGTPSERAMPFGELHHKLVEHYAPPSVLVTDDLEVLHVSESAGRYLVLGGGEPTRSLVRLVPEALRLDLRAALYGAQQSDHGTDTRTVEATIDGQARRIELGVRVVELPEPAGRMLLVTFDESEPRGAPLAVPEPPALLRMEPVVRRLEDELRRTRDHLRMTIEQYETSVEELKASNEEMHAINEELRSATEELETSKEELQSVNEELTTLNHELKDKIDEVSRAKADLQNLMAATEIGVLFLDRDMRIQRFTPRASEVFNIISTDVGRPLTDLTHQLVDVDLASEARAVLRDLRTIDREVTTRVGRRYLVRLHPYRSLEDRIEGVVLTFLDASALTG